MPERETALRRGVVSWREVWRYAKRRALQSTNAHRRRSSGPLGGLGAALYRWRLSLARIERYAEGFEKAEVYSCARWLRKWRSCVFIAQV